MARRKRSVELIPFAQVERRILSVRGQRVMLDSDLAELYGVATKELNKAVKRNLRRFPPDFMFELSEDEAESLRFQIGTSNSRGGRRYLPHAFTEQGVAMLSSVLHSQRAVRVNVAIMRAFVRVRELVASNVELARRLEELETKCDGRFRTVFDSIRELMSEKRPARKRRWIGFRATKSR